MPEVEFLVPVAQDAPEQPFLEPRDAAGLLRRHLPLTIATALSAMAAVLSVFAASGPVYRQRVGSTVAFSLDGWGRTLATGGVVTQGHGPRFGVPVVVCGAVCALLAGWLAIQIWRGRTVAPRVAGRLGPALGLVAGGVMLGSAVSAWTYCDSLRAALVSPTRFPVGGDRTFPQQLSVSVQPGSFWILAAVAGACAVLGALAAAVPLVLGAEPGAGAPAAHDRATFADEYAAAEPTADTPAPAEPPGAGPTVVANPAVRLDGEEELLGS